MNAIAYQIYVRRRHQVSHFFVVRRDLRHVLFVEDLLGKDLLHHSIAIVHLRYLGHHSVGARIDLRYLAREEYAIEVLLCGLGRLGKPFLHHSFLTIVCEVIWPILPRFVPSLVQGVGLQA